MMKTKKSQIFGIDLMVAAGIFAVGILILFFYSINYSTDTNEASEQMKYDGNLIANEILSSGSPLNWNAGNVIVPGILSGDKINETKLASFYNISNADYKNLKLLLNTKYDFWLFSSEQININGNDIEGIGKKPLNQENLIKITKASIYKNSPTIMTFYIWN